MPKGLCFADITLFDFFNFVTVPLKTNFLRVYCTVLYQILRKDRYIWVSKISIWSFWLLLKGRCYGNRFLGANRRKLAYPSSFYALAFHIDACVITVDEPSMSDEDCVNFCPETPEFCRRVCTGRNTRGALPRISTLPSFVPTPRDYLSLNGVTVWRRQFEWVRTQRWRHGGGGGRHTRRDDVS